MATYFFGVNHGAGLNGGTVTGQATTTGKDVEVVVNSTANVPSKSDLLLALEKIVCYLTTRDAAW